MDENHSIDVYSQPKPRTPRSSRPGPLALIVIPALLLLAAACGSETSAEGVQGSQSQASVEAAAPFAAQQSSETVPQGDGTGADRTTSVPPTTSVPATTSVDPVSTVSSLSTTASTVTNVSAAAGDVLPFCAADDELLAAMAEVTTLGRGQDRFAFSDAHIAFYDARLAWDPDTADLFDATFAIRQILTDLGSVFPLTGDMPTVADAFEAATVDPAWVAARADIDSWRATNCSASAGSGGKGNEDRGDGGDGGGDQPTAHEALAEALAVSVLRGQSDLSEVIDTVAEARCVAERAVADIGLDRYHAAYGITVDSLESELSMFGVVYDLTDADAMAVGIADCVDLGRTVRRTLTGNGVDGSVHDCVVSQSDTLVLHMVEAQLSYDRERVDRLVSEMNEVVAGCGG